MEVEGARSGPRSESRDVILPSTTSPASAAAPVKQLESMVKEASVDDVMKVTCELLMRLGRSFLPKIQAWLCLYLSSSFRSLFTAANVYAYPSPTMPPPASTPHLLRPVRDNSRERSLCLQME